MPLLLGLIGVVLIVCAVNNTLGSNSGNLGLSDLLKRDFTGPNNFLMWIAAIVIAGAFGYVPKFKPIATGFLGLIFVGIILSNKKNGTDAFTSLLDAFSGASSSGEGSIGQSGFQTISYSGGGDSSGGFSFNDITSMLGSSDTNSSDNLFSSLQGT